MQARARFFLIFPHPPLPLLYFFSTYSPSLPPNSRPIFFPFLFNLPLISFPFPSHPLSPFSPHPFSLPYSSSRLSPLILFPIPAHPSSLLHLSILPPPLLHSSVHLPNSNSDHRIPTPYPQLTHRIERRFLQKSRIYCIYT